MSGPSCILQLINISAESEDLVPLSALGSLEELHVRYDDVSHAYEALHASTAWRHLPKLRSLYINTDTSAQNTFLTNENARVLLANLAAATSLTCLELEHNIFYEDLQLCQYLTDGCWVWHLRYVLMHEVACCSTASSQSPRQCARDSLCKMDVYFQCKLTFNVS